MGARTLAATARVCGPLRRPAAMPDADSEFELGAQFFPRPRCMCDTERRERVETLPSPFVS